MDWQDYWMRLHEGVINEQSLHEHRHLTRPAPIIVGEFLNYIPTLARELHLSIVLNIAYAAKHLTTEQEDAVFNFMANNKARDSPYTLLYYFLSLHSLAARIDVVYRNNVMRFRHIDDACVSSSFDSFMMQLDMHEGSRDYRRFTRLTKTMMYMYNWYAHEPVEFE